MKLYVESLVRSTKDDALGVILSVACLIHCVGVSLALAAMPVLGHEIEHNHFHAWFAVGVIAVGLLAFGRGYCLHRSVLVLIGACCGIALLVIGMWYEDKSFVLGTGFTVLGSVLLVGSHLRNSYLGRRCRSCCGG